MTSLQHQQEQASQSEPLSSLPLLLRLSWMAIGNVALFLCAALIAKGIAPGVMDIAFFTVVVGLILVRYVDIARFKGQTSEGRPATLSHWRRYLVMLAVISAGVWALARIVRSYKWL